ncbi:MAG: adenylate/guanylate cyclase domain-containing protein [Saprospiraceae bacterium]
MLTLLRKRLLSLLIPVLLTAAGGLCAQADGAPTTEAQLSAALAAADGAAEKAALNYQFAEYLLKKGGKSNAELADKYAEAAYRSSTNEAMRAGSAYLVSRTYDEQRNDGKQDSWLNTTIRHAMAANDADLIIRASTERSKMATRDRNYRRAYEINQEAFTYFSQSGNSLTELRAQSEIERAQLERKRRKLQEDLEKLSTEAEILREETDILDEENARLETTARTRTRQLEESAAQLATVAEEKERIEQERQQSEVRVKSLSRKALEQEAVVQEAEAKLAQQELAVAEADMRTMQAEMKEQQTASLRNYGLAAIAILALLVFLFYLRFRTKKKAAKQLEASNLTLADERRRSDELLLNILPAPIATELKENGMAKTRSFPEVTVLFSDFVNFTRIAEQLGPEELVRQLDHCFQAFDDIMGQYEDVEKIKTIGDAYMAAGGLNERRSVPHNMVRAALEMQQFLLEEGERRRRLGLPFFEARIGLHTGPVVAGVVGKRKFAYDIWGDTVNLASRVESQSEPNRVNVSETTYGLIKYQFECTYRGKVEAKNKGRVDMYFVERELMAAAV